MSDKNLTVEDIDRLGQALISLTKELWIVKDRQKILEAALADAGVVLPETIDKYQPDEVLSQQLETERAQLIEQVLTTLAK